MRKSIVTFCCFCTVLAHAQVWNGRLDFHSQQEIDDFSNFSYSTVTGSVSINDGFDGVYDIRNLAGLASITAVGEYLTISDCRLLTSLAFLNVAGAWGMQVVNNPVLPSIGSVPLTSLPGDILIKGNAILTGIRAFSSITSNGGIITISDNPVLTDLAGFANLENANVINLINNAGLTNLVGFSQLRTVNTLNIRKNASLANLQGLSGLQTVYALSILENPAMTNLDGLSIVNVPSGNVTIMDNPLLQNLDGLSRLAGDITMVIYRNNSLQHIYGPVGITRLGGLHIQENSLLKTISGFNNVIYAGPIEFRQNPQLETITGFEKTAIVGTELVLVDNWILKTMNAFANLGFLGHFHFERNYIADDIQPMPLVDTIFGDFNVVTDTMLKNINFFPGLRFVGKDIRFGGIERLENIDGLSNLESIGRDFAFEGLFFVKSIQALSKLTSINGYLRLSGAYELENLAGLRNLKKVGKELYIQGFFKLTNLDDLVNLDSVGEALVLYRDFVLTNLNGLRNVRNTTHVVITDNALLSSFCGLYGLFTDTPPGGLIDIRFNQANPTAQDIRNGGPCSALPVHFLVFNLKCLENKISLNWVTANEVNNSHFIVQRSSNGTTWTDLDLVSAAGNNGGVSKYSFTDEQPISNAYYRLAQVDLDRQVHYSSVIRAACAAAARYNAWPNPATDKVVVSISVAKASGGVIRLLDSKGKIISTKNMMLLSGQNQVEMNLTGIPKGIYFLQVIYDGTREQRRTVLVKN